MNEKLKGRKEKWIKIWLAFMRIVLGIFLLMAGTSKLNKNFIESMPGVLNYFANGNPAISYLSENNPEFKPLIEKNQYLKYITIEGNPSFKTLSQGNNIGWYKNFLLKNALSNAKTFAYLSAVGETLLGISFILGIFTGLSGIVSIFMFLNYHLATSWMGGASAFVNLYALLATLIVVATYAGRTLGLDYFLSKKIRMRIFW